MFDGRDPLFSRWITDRLPSSRLECFKQCQQFFCGLNRVLKRYVPSGEYSLRRMLQAIDLVADLPQCWSRPVGSLARLEPDPSFAKKDLEPFPLRSDNDLQSAMVHRSQSE